MTRDEILHDKKILEAERATYVDALRIATMNVHRADGALAWMDHKLTELDKAEMAAPNEPPKEQSNG